MEELSERGEDWIGWDTLQDPTIRDMTTISRTQGGIPRDPRWTRGAWAFRSELMTR